MNKDQLKGRSEEVKGKVKELAGKLMGDAALELEGALQYKAGKALAAFGEAKDRRRKGAVGAEPLSGVGGESSLERAGEVASALGDWEEDGGQPDDVPVEVQIGPGRWRRLTDERARTSGLCATPYRPRST